MRCGLEAGSESPTDGYHTTQALYWLQVLGLDSAERLPVHGVAHTGSPFSNSPSAELLSQEAFCELSADDYLHMRGAAAVLPGCRRRFACRNSGNDRSVRSSAIHRPAVSVPHPRLADAALEASPMLTRGTDGDR